jgi:hypothetical protein
MVRSPSCFNLYWGWLLIFLGSHESQVADPMIEADADNALIAGLTHFDRSPLQITTGGAAGRPPCPPCRTLHDI